VEFLRVNPSEGIRDWEYHPPLLNVLRHQYSILAFQKTPKVLAFHSVRDSVEVNLENYLKLINNKIEIKKLSAVFETTLNVNFNILQFARLFAKVPRPGDSEVTFSVFVSSCHLLLLV